MVGKQSKMDNIHEAKSTDEIMDQQVEASNPAGTLAGPEELPIGFYDKGKFHKGYEVRPLDADVLTAIDSERQNPFRTFGRIVAQGLVKIFDVETKKEVDGWQKRTSKLFFPDVFFLMTEIIIVTKGSSYVPTVYKCPQCNKFTKFENEPGGGDEDNPDQYDLNQSDDLMTSADMEDLRNLELIPFTGDKPSIELELKHGILLGDTRYKNYGFRIPEIHDYITAANRYGSGKVAAIERQVLKNCLISLDEAGKGGKDDRSLVHILSKYGDKVLKLNLKEYAKITNKLNRIGYNYQNHKTVCSACGFEHTVVFDLTNFFGSVLGIKS